MKLVMLTYLEEDEPCVDRLLGRVGVQAFSRASVEGHTPGGTGGWYGETAPYESRALFAFLPEAKAAELVAAVRLCTEVEDPKHPIRAFQLPVEAAASCGCEPGSSEAERADAGGATG